MRKLYLLLPLIFSFAISSCPKEPDPPPPPPPPTLDQRLVGGRWYFPKDYSSPYSDSLTSNSNKGYYQFTSDGKLIYSPDTTYYNIENTLSGKSVYSKDGVVYWKDTNQKAIQYSFHSTFPYRSGSIVYPAIGDEYYTLDFLASKGDLITYRIYYSNGSIYNNPYPSVEFLVRFQEDGTQYNYE